MAQDMRFPVLQVGEGFVAVEDGEEAGVGYRVVVIAFVLVFVIFVGGVGTIMGISLGIMVEDIMCDQKLRCQPRVHRCRRIRRRISVAG